ncbi:MAG: mandelate racemase/muconate lactonizing enzyme family protein [Caldilineaceae bacterium]|nr:mandelate racemase/muconate lactonizing enzyme family protein [Caldilineaceae bacterium]MDE0338049.1 mandelate racemase/muconate lactonizing enzyme family protein [Caldilineaceae bacterium]
MKIVAISTLIVHVNHRGDWLHVVVETDAGITGVGEASHNSNDALCAAAVGQFNQILEGEDPRQVARIRQMLRRKDGGSAYNTALSGLEQALWDVLAQSLSVPLHVLFGGAVRDRLRLYANINRHVKDRSPEGFARAARQAADEGFTAIKMAPFDELRHPYRYRTGPRADWRPGVERVRAVRKAIGDEVELAVDCHSRMEVSEAVVVGQELADQNLFWYEEPVAHSDPEGLAAVAARVPQPIASAESVFGVEGFRPFTADRCVDVIMPDVKHCGGILELNEIAAAARMRQVLVAPHNPAGPLSTAATAQAAATWPNFYILEFAWGEVDWRSELLSPPERIEEGHLVLSQEPGTGHRLNPKTVEAHRVSVAGSADSSKVRFG